MIAKYYGRGSKKNEFGETIRKYSPCVGIVMKEKEVEKFEKMMKWIEDNICDYNYSLVQIEEGKISAYVDVDNKYDAQWFLEDYKNAKKSVK